MALSAVCFLFCISISMVLELGFPVPSAGLLVALQEKNIEHTRHHVRDANVVFSLAEFAAER